VLVAGGEPQMIGFALLDVALAHEHAQDRAAVTAPSRRPSDAMA
jgi:hypothetical protein